MNVRFRWVLLMAQVLLGCAGHPPEALEAPNAPDGVLLIVVDALRPDYLGVYGYERMTSPHLDKWAEQAAVFERAFTTSPWTLPSFGSMLTGELPARHAAGSRVRESNWTVSSRLNDALPTLPETLAAAGFVTGAIINNPWLPRGVGLERGFDTYDYKSPDEQNHRRASEVVELSLKWIAESSESPFFFMMHILDPHMPYDAPAPVRGRFTSGMPGGFELPVVEPRKIRKRAQSIADSERQFITAAYEEEIAYVDQELGRLFTALEEVGLFERLVIVLTADHGEELFDHGDFEHGHGMYQELLRIPLLVWGPDVLPGRHTAPVSLVDLYDTILESVGATSTAGTAGQSLWSAVTKGEEIPERPILAEATLYGPERRAIIRWPLKLTLETGVGRRRLYNLETDPGEQSDLAPEEERAVEYLSNELRSTMQAARQGVEAEALPLDEEMLRELRSLGYVN